MGSSKLLTNSFFSIRFFSLFQGLIVFSVLFLFNHFTDIPENLETRIIDLHFTLKQSLTQRSDQENVIREQRSHKISRDILIIGIDSRTLDVFGRWPFARSTHADLLKSFSRIKKQEDRESIVLLDILINEVADRAFEDAILLDTMEDHGRVALQTQLHGLPFSTGREEEHAARFDALLENYGEIRHVQGDLSRVIPYYGIESPLVPYGEKIHAYGHASYREDKDKVYRRQQLVARYSRKIGEIPFGNEPVPDIDFNGRGHLGWIDKNGRNHTVEFPVTEEQIVSLHRNLLENGIPRIDNSGNNSWIVSIYQDHFIPAVTLSLALHYFNKTLDDLDVQYGSHIRINNPMNWNSETETWEPYTIPVGFGSRRRMQVLNEITIPIDENGNMRINFMGLRSSSDPGGVQTFPVRSYAAYAKNIRGSDPETWSETKKLNNKILMVGAFTSGMADDEKITPLGLMFGVEVHANALNTIIMNNFIRQIPAWANNVIMLVLILFFAWLTSRMKNIGWSVAVLLSFILISFLAVTLLFEYRNTALDWANPVFGVLLTYLAVVLYRVLSAERDKKQIENVFGQFISPAIVEELTNSLPELGGEDVDVTVFFSDIRAFSRISERLSAQELVMLLNDYLTDMTDNLVNDFHGTLDKYIGDAIMAFWGAPRSQDDHAVRACRCAVMQIYLLDKLNERIQVERGEDSLTIDIGIGLNSGTCMVGYMGSEGRKNYTAMGDTVNLASRLEGVNKVYGTSIIISEDTWTRIKHEPFIARELDEIRVKGRSNPVTIYELLDYDGDLLSGM